MDIEKKIELISRAPTEEILTMDELRSLLETKERPIAYDGFEPSGIAHLASGTLRAIKVQDMLDAGCKFKLLLADWHAWINNKMGGDLEMIKKAGKYLIEVWKASGVDAKKVELVWASDRVKDSEYWKKVINISKTTTLNRMIRCSTIMGRKESEMQYTSQLFYPAMQCADIFDLEADICQLGMDQRKVNILAREVGPKLGFWKPVAVHHHLLMSLQGPEKMGGAAAFDSKKEIDEEIASKMSKSKPMTAIFVHDTPEEIRKKISAAFCPEKQVEENPILEISKYIIFRKTDTLAISRPAKFGGNLELHGFEELAKIYREGKLHPMDLKNAVSEELIKILEPVRAYFEKNREAKELLEAIRKANVTR